MVLPRGGVCGGVHFGGAAYGVISADVGGMVHSIVDLTIIRNVFNDVILEKAVLVFSDVCFMK